MASVPRELLRWLGSLRLSFPLCDIFPKVSSGILIDEVWAHYFPLDADAISQSGEASKHSLKVNHWSGLVCLLGKRGLSLPWDIVEAAINDDGVAVVSILSALHDFCTRNGELQDSISTNYSSIRVIEKQMFFEIPGHNRALNSVAVSDTCMRHAEDERKACVMDRQNHSDQSSPSTPLTKSQVHASSNNHGTVECVALSDARRTIPRDLLHWLRTLNLSSPLRDTICSVSNGVLIAEICARYLPRETAAMGSFSKVSARHLKLANWNRLLRFLRRHGVPLRGDIVEAVINSDSDAVVAVLSQVYAVFAKHKLKAETMKTRDASSECLPCRPCFRIDRTLRNARGDPASCLDADIRGDDGMGQPISTIMSLSSPEFAKARTCIASPIEFARRARETPVHAFDHPPLASSSRRAWRSMVHSRHFETIMLPGGDSARYPWVGGSPWQTKK